MTDIPASHNCQRVSSIGGYESSQLEVYHDISYWTTTWGWSISGSPHGLENPLENELALNYGTPKSSHFDLKMGGRKNMISGHPTLGFMVTLW